MQNIYKQTGFLDTRAVEEFGLNNEILMENAANVLEQQIDKNAHSNSMIIVVCGSGDNGADGLALARKIHKKYNTKVFMPLDSKSELNKLQKARALKAGIQFIDKLFLCDIVVDCLFGSGFSGELDFNTRDIIETMNKIARFNIACDIPSGINKDGIINDAAFSANLTIAMGALKLAYFSDKAKDFIGELKVANLGLSRQSYELDSNFKLLDISDLKLPLRTKQNCHKGNFGHACVIAGQKEGACILAARSAFAFGSGLVSIIGEVKHLPSHIMQSQNLPKNCNAIAFGMGLGNAINKYNFDFLGKIPSVIDADMFSNPNLENMLKSGNIVLTPHLKEFGALLRMLNLGDFNAEFIAKNRIDLVLSFSAKFPQIVLLLKGANTIIAFENKLYINTLGNSNLAKGGSGDILSGMIAGLLAQNYNLLDAAISASIAHALAAKHSSYGLEPLDLINNIKNLG